MEIKVSKVNKERRREEKRRADERREERRWWEEWREEESQHLEAVRHHRTLMVNLLFCRRGGRKGNLFPVIFHLVSLCSDILHLLHQLFAACADRWLLLFDMHSPPAPFSSYYPPTKPPTGKNFSEKCQLRTWYELQLILLIAEKTSWSLWETVCVDNKQTCPGWSDEK